MLNQVVNIDQYKLVVESLIGEGGFGYIFKVRDTGTNAIFALKKINSSDKEIQSEIENEIDVLKSLQKHQYILEFITSVQLDQQLQPINKQADLGSYKNRFTYLLLTEYCDHGTLNDLGLPIQELEKSCRIIYQVASALKHMHSKGIIHRDIKAENILFDKNGRVKICDFGSSTRSSFEPTIYWTPLERDTVADEMQRHTTPIYRAPEILETYLHYPINCAIDIWALGCLIYYMRFGQHAFPDYGKLSIVNCCYSIPKDVSSSDPLVTIVKQCLVADPRERISIETLLSSFELDFPDMDLSGSIVPFTPAANKVSQVSQEANLDQESDSIRNSIPKESREPCKKSAEKEESHKLPASDYNVDTLIDFASSSPRKSGHTANSTHKSVDSSDPAMRAGLSELMEPSKKLDNIDNLLDMGLPGSNEVTQDHEVLSPKKAMFSSDSGSNIKKDAFDDLLDSFKTSLPVNGTLGQTQNNLINTCSYDGFGIDPKLKITEWKDSRRGNIRALLSSLHLVLSDDFRWKPIGMHQLVTDSDVKKIYRLACLAIHPDKLASCDEDTKEMAQMIFVELNDAWSKFEGK